MVARVIVAAIKEMEVEAMAAVMAEMEEVFMEEDTAREEEERNEKNN